MLNTSLHLVQHTFKETPTVTQNTFQEGGNFVAKFKKFLVTYAYINGESFWYLDNVPFDTFTELLDYGVTTKVFTPDDYTCTCINEPSDASSVTSQ